MDSSNYTHFYSNQQLPVKKRVSFERNQNQSQLKLQCNQKEGAHSYSIVAHAANSETTQLLPTNVQNTPPTTPLIFCTNGVIRTSTPTYPIPLASTSSVITRTSSPLNISAHQTGLYTPPATPMDITAADQQGAMGASDNSLSSPEHSNKHNDNQKPSDKCTADFSRMNAYTLPTEPMYNTPLLPQMIQNEKLLHKRYVEKRMADIPLKRTYNREKARPVCRQFDSLSPSEANQNETQKRIQMRLINNQKSLQSRYKQKLSRITDSLTVLFLRERIAEYERRIETIIKIFLDPHAPTNEDDRKQL